MPTDAQIADVPTKVLPPQPISCILKQFFRTYEGRFINSQVILQGQCLDTSAHTTHIPTYLPAWLQALCVFSTDCALGASRTEYTWGADNLTCMIAHAVMMAYHTAPGV